MYVNCGNIAAMLPLYSRKVAYCYLLENLLPPATGYQHCTHITATHLEKIQNAGTYSRHHAGVVEGRRGQVNGHAHPGRRADRSASETRHDHRVRSELSLQGMDQAGTQAGASQFHLR